MSRVQIEMPKEFVFTTTLMIRIDDINYGGHLSNDKVLALAHESRLRLLQNLGYSELDLAGVSLIMADAAVVFRSEGFQGNHIQVEMAIENFSKMGFEVYYKMTNISTKKVLAQIKTGIVCYNYKEKKIKEVPKEFIEKVKALSE